MEVTHLVKRSAIKANQSHAHYKTIQVQQKKSQTHYHTAKIKAIPLQKLNNTLFTNLTTLKFLTCACKISQQIGFASG